MAQPERLPSYHAIPQTAGAGTHKVENTGSTARDHLANERTFLAWLRTAISLLSLALAIAKFSPDNAGLGFAFMFACLGSALLLYSGRRYFEVMRALEQGRFRINTGDVSLLLAFLGLAPYTYEELLRLEARRPPDLPSGITLSSMVKQGPRTTGAPSQI